MQSDKGAKEKSLPMSVESSRSQSVPRVSRDGFDIMQHEVQSLIAALEQLTKRWWPMEGKLWRDARTNVRSCCADDEERLIE